MKTAQMQWITYEKQESVVTITLNRPRALNALNAQMIDELFCALKRTAEDQDLRVLILTGAGRAFCFGADFSQFIHADGVHSETGSSLLALLEKAQQLIVLLATMDKPSIAAINGFATGLGLDLALACDLRIAARRAKLAEAYISMGLIPDGGGTFFLPRLIGLARAAELILFGKPLNATEAERIGLINLVVADDQLAATARQWATQLARGPIPALRLAKVALHRNLEGDIVSALKTESELQKICLSSEDHQRAVRAFQEKRGGLFREK